MATLGLTDDQRSLVLDLDETRPRYHALRAIATIKQTLAVLAFIVGIFAWLAGVQEGQALYGLAAFGVGVVVCLLLWAAGELIRLLVDIEANTRRAARR